MAWSTRQARHSPLSLRSRAIEYQEHCCIREESRQIEDGFAQRLDQKRSLVRLVRVAD